MTASVCPCSVLVQRATARTLNTAWGWYTTGRTCSVSTPRAWTHERRLDTTSASPRAKNASGTGSSYTGDSIIILVRKVFKTTTCGMAIVACIQFYLSLLKWLHKHWDTHFSVKNGKYCRPATHKSLKCLHVQLCTVYDHKLNLYFCDITPAGYLL